jgi:hypothetical protein
VVSWLYNATLQVTGYILNNCYMANISELQDTVVQLSKQLSEEDAITLVITMQQIEQTAYNNGLLFKATH